MLHVVIDGNNLAMASAAVTGNLLNGTLFGFIRTVNSIMRKSNPTRQETLLYVAWDHKECWRFKRYPEYKANRKPKDADPEREKSHEDFKKQREKIKELLKLMPVIQVEAQGYEADDIAGHISHFSDNRKPTILVSNDRDWWQLVKSHCSVYMPMKDIKLTEDNYMEIVEVENPGQYVIVKALMGDGGDNIPGAGGIGDKTSRAYVLGNTVTRGKLAIIEAWKADPNGYGRSLELVDLRGRKEEKQGYKFQPVFVEGIYRSDILHQRFKHYMFESFLKNFESDWMPNQVPFLKGLDSADPAGRIF